MTLQNSIINILTVYIKKQLGTRTIITNVLLLLYVVRNINHLDYDTIFNETSDTSYINIIKKQFNYCMCKIDEDEFNKIHQYLIENINNTFDNILNEIIIYFETNKELSNNNKQIMDFTSNIQLTDYIIKMANPKLEKILNLCSGIGNFFIDTANHFKNTNQSLNLLKNMYGFEIDDEIKLWSLLNIYLSTNIMMKENIITGDIIHDNLFNNYYDLIVSNFPVGIRNIIHANCCNKIKGVKIRGTKSEPLILQLILTLINKNGRAILIVPNHLLYNESKQHVETRKYLLTNFCINKIISIDKHLQTTKGHKTSILYIERKEPKNEIFFSKISLKNNIISEENLSTIKYDLIEKNNYILWHEKYMETDENKVIINSMKLSEIADIIHETNINERINDLNVLSKNYLVFPTYINDNKKVYIGFNDFILKKDTFTLLVKNSDICLQKYLNYYIEQTIQKNILLYTTGKLNKIDFDKILDMNIKIPSIKTQNTIINYFDLNNKLIETNKDQIIRFNNLKCEFINLFNDKFEKVKLKDICTIEFKPQKTNTIMIQRNSNLAGTVSLSNENSIESMNIYYLNNIKEELDEKCLYHILKNSEKQFFNLANLTSTINLNRTNLENFEIQNYPSDIQNQIILQSDLYDKICNDLIEMNSTIVSKNIVNEITKLEKHIQ